MTESRPGDIFQPGDLLNNTYRIQSMLGRGGTSEVYQARSEISGRVVALKALKSEFSKNEDYLVLMTREEEIRDIQHDAVVRYYDTQRTPDGHVYLVMDYVDGPALDQKLASGGMSAEDLLTIGSRVAQGLVVAHSRNIVHRDLSPDNIILRNGNPAEAVIIDFGIAKDTNPGAETIVGNEFAGKYAYAAPEQLSGQTDQRSDIYSLGALLLATFRGQKPDIGNNPMEVVQKKSQPLDTGGVPEPLKTLIDRMTAPLPDDRLSSAKAVLDVITPPAAAPAPSEDATVIVPRARQAEASAAPKPKPAAPPKKKSGALLPLLAIVLVAALGGGGYFAGLFDGLLGPRYPVADPFILTVERHEGEPPTASGNVPSDDAQAALSDLMNGLGGSANLTLATGNISESWGSDTIALVDQVAPLDEYRVEITNDNVRITGMTVNKAMRKSVLASLEAGLPGAFTGTSEVIQGPRVLNAGQVQQLMDQYADCGPLNLVAPPPQGYGMGSRVLITGKLAKAGSRVGLFDALSAIAGDRQISIDAEVLEPALCLIETALPKAPSGGFDIRFGFGDRPDPNPSGRYYVGENPIIDVVVPADLTTGYLWVSVLDVSGNVFHLLPNLNRQDNSISSLRGDAEGEVPVRVAFSLAEAADTSRLAFLVDDTSLGKSKVIVLYSDKPVFDGMRPTTESAASYAQALKDRTQQGDLRVEALDSRILVTAKP